MNKTTTDDKKPRRFRVALSYPGEERAFVEDVAEKLAAELGRDRVFYDRWYEAELAGRNGDLKLHRIYGSDSDLVVPFFSKDYSKPWCKLEWDAVRGMLLQRQREDSVVPIAMDDTPIEGWSAVDIFVERRGRSADELATLILERLRLLRTTEPQPPPPPPPVPPTRRKALALWSAIIVGVVLAVWLVHENTDWFKAPNAIHGYDVPSARGRPNTSSVKPRVFIHTVRDDQRDRAERLKSRLETDGFPVSDIIKHERHPEKAALLIYWNRDDNVEAAELERIFEASGFPDVRVLDRSPLVPERNVSRVFEVWLAR